MVLVSYRVNSIEQDLPVSVEVSRTVKSPLKVLSSSGGESPVVNYIKYAGLMGYKWFEW